jgi:hypothetical protein
MCYAILEVKYTAASIPTELQQVSDEMALEEKLVALQNNPQVERVKVFTHDHTRTRTMVWEITN